MSEAADPLPDVLARIADACGLPAAMALAASFGGRELYIPRPEAIGEQHPMALALGLATARRTAEILGHNKLIIPLGPAASFARRKMALRRLKAEGKSNSDTARILGIHVRTVEKRNQVDRALKRSDPDLFD